LIKKAQQAGYEVNLLYFWLNSPQTAADRVARRVSKGGHNIPIEVIERRYYRGIKNLLNLYIPVCDKWYITNNMTVPSEAIAQGTTQFGEVIFNADIWERILKQSHDNAN
jgi:predicted ABC-type ATPase